jgi:hypothetical protein
MSTRWRSSLITIALLAVLVVGYNVYGDLAGRFDKDLKKLEADARSRLPIKVDEFTTLVDVTYEPHKHVYWHVIEVKDGERVDRQKLKQSVTAAKLSNWRGAVMRARGDHLGRGGARAEISRGRGREGVRPERRSVQAPVDLGARLTTGRKPQPTVG